MDRADLDEALGRLRAAGTDGADIEAKRARGGFPDIGSTLSAFSNTTGGLLLLGVDEDAGFEVVGVSDPSGFQSHLQSYCAQRVEPPIRPAIESIDYDGAQVIAVEVPPLEPGRRPCVVKKEGEAYQRVGDSNQRLTAYEFHLMKANAGRPRDDREVVVDATLDDLDLTALERLLVRVREREASAFAGLNDDQVLLRLGVLVRAADGLRPTVAGLLALGRDPQTFFPQLGITFVRYAGTKAGEAGPGDQRFLDNRTMRGSIPVMVSDALAHLRRNMAIRASIEGVGRIDTWEYPVTALREAIVNAVAHRDLHPLAMGSQVQIEMYSDRLVIRNPGGLYGPVRVEELGEDGISSSRNEVLMKVLENVELEGEAGTVAENRAVGISTMIRALKSAGMGLPDFQDSLARFQVTFPNHTLMSAEVVQWLDSLRQADLSPGQCMALATMRSGTDVTNPTYRAMTEQDSTEARQELQDLVSRGLVEAIGEHRWTRYRLSPNGPRPRRTVATPNKNWRSVVLEALGDQELRRRDLEAIVGVKNQRMRAWLRRMQDEGLVELVGPPQSNRARYRAVNPLPTRGQLRLELGGPDEADDDPR